VVRQNREVLISDQPFCLDGNEKAFLRVVSVRQSAERRGAINMLCRRDWPRVFVAALCWVPLFLGAPRAVHAEDEGASSTGPRNSGGFPQLDSKYLFGNFTRGASVGDEGERAIEPDTIANFGKRSGQYAATLTELEFEYSPTRFLQLRPQLSAQATPVASQCWPRSGGPHPA
jgi:hypothetical protein